MIDEAAVRRPRVLFYSPDLYGLGHLRKTLAFAGELARRRPDAVLRALTSVDPPAGFAVPPQVSLVTLPDAPADRGMDATVRARRVRLIEESVNAFAPHLVFVDHTPAGRQGELVYPLACLRGGEPRVALVVGLSDVNDDPATVRAYWRAQGTYDLLDRTYDRILVYGSRDVFDPVVEYGLSPAAAAKTRFCGYLTRPVPRTPPEQIRAALGVGPAPLVVVTVGGGGDGGALLRAYLAACRAGALAGLAAYVVAGPLLPPAEWDQLAAAATVPGVSLVHTCPDLVSHLAAADLVVTMGGYNTLAEAVGLGRRTVVVPRVRPWREQLVRAERFARRGLVAAVIHPDELTPARLAEAVRQSLAAPPPAATLSFGGLECVGEVLASALPA